MPASLAGMSFPVADAIARDDSIGQKPLRCPAMPLTMYGLREWLTITIVLGAIAAALGWWLSWWLVIPVIGIWMAIVSFFRDPIRRIPTDLPPGSMLSPGDGTITKVFRVDHHEATGGEAQVVRMFLSLLNVHVNRAPFDGEVVDMKYVPGKFLDARSEESAQVNEWNLVTMQIDRGDGSTETIGVRQVSGKVARRIVCPISIGTRLTRGEKFGMIKFGSTAELILPRPDDVTVHVKEGQAVRGGLTVLATLKPG